MSKLKRKAVEKIKLHSTFKSDTIKFSWQYLTTNKTHNFDYFKGDLRQELSARQGLSDFADEAFTGTNDARPAYRQMMKDAAGLFG